jgi:hypothetical protein
MLAKVTGISRESHSKGSDLFISVGLGSQVGNRTKFKFGKNRLGAHVMNNVIASDLRVFFVENTACHSVFTYLVSSYQQQNITDKMQQADTQSYEGCDSKICEQIHIIY